MDATKLAKELIDLHDRPRLVAPFSTRFPGLTAESGYAAARQLHAHRLAQGWKLAGRKNGFTNRGIWERYGVNGPMWGAVYDRTLIHDRMMMETAGAQCLFLAGYFEDQMSGRHNIRWYSELGAGFFSRAASGEASPHKARVLTAIARRFEPWRRRHAQVSRDLRDLPFLLSLPKPPTPF